MTRQIILVGAGGHARSLVDVIEAEGKWSIAGFIDRADSEPASLFGYRCLGDDSNLADLLLEVPQAVIAVGQLKSPGVRQSLFTKLVTLGAILPAIVSPKATVSPRASLGMGTVVMHGAVVNAGVRVGSNCIINSLALVEHDSVIEDHSHISTGARVNGGCFVGTGSFVGSGAVIFQGIRVSDYSVIPAGAVVKRPTDLSSGRK